MAFNLRNHAITGLDVEVNAAFAGMSTKQFDHALDRNIAVNIHNQDRPQIARGINGRNHALDTQRRLLPLAINLTLQKHQGVGNQRGTICG